MNYEISDMLLKHGRTIRNNDEIPIQLTHADSVDGLWFIMQGVSAGVGTVSVEFSGSVDGTNGWIVIGSPLTLTSTFTTELQVAPAAGSTMRPFMRAKFTVPAAASLVFSNFKRTKRV